MKCYAGTISELTPQGLLWWEQARADSVHISLLRTPFLPPRLCCHFMDSAAIF
jgi:hypothetical protein